MTEYRVFITITFDFNLMQYIHFSRIIMYMYCTLSSSSNYQVVDLWTSNWFWCLMPINGVIYLRKHSLYIKILSQFKSLFCLWKDFSFRKILFKKTFLSLKKQRLLFESVTKSPSIFCFGSNFCLLII